MRILIVEDEEGIAAFLKQGLEEESFKKHIIRFEDIDTLYIFTDGYADQFGGPNGKKFKYKKFKETLLNNQAHSMISQKEILNNTIKKWQGDLDQIDDILVLGIKF